jgi:hypothetical protein
LRGSCTASFDKKRVPISAIAAGQQSALLTIDTACHGVHGASAAAGRFAPKDWTRFHMNIVYYFASVGIISPVRTKSAGREIPLP